MSQSDLLCRIRSSDVHYLNKHNNKKMVTLYLLIDLSNSAPHQAITTEGPTFFYSYHLYNIIYYRLT